MPRFRPPGGGAAEASTSHAPPCKPALHGKTWGAQLTARLFGGRLQAFIGLMPFCSALRDSEHNAARLAQLSRLPLATIFLLVGVLGLPALISALHAHQRASGEVGTEKYASPPFRRGWSTRSSFWPYFQK